MFGLLREIRLSLLDPDDPVSCEQVYRAEIKPLDTRIEGTVGKMVPGTNDQVGAEPHGVTTREYLAQSSLHHACQVDRGRQDATEHAD